MLSAPGITGAPVFGCLSVISENSDVIPSLNVRAKGVVRACQVRSGRQSRFHFRPKLERLEDRTLPDGAMASILSTYHTSHILVQFESGFQPAGLLPSVASVS